MKPLLAVAMSGGVDSTMAANLTKKRGHPVVGIHFITGYENVGHSVTDIDNPPHKKARLEFASRKIAPLSVQLKIHIEILDIQREFEDSVVRYFMRTYQMGQTPNPCMVCNPLIKFGSLYSAAKKLGASAIATGHYARTLSDKYGRFRLLKGVDPRKDQSYFLAMLTQQQLGIARFPLGDYTKSQVKQMAINEGISSHIKEESQDVCFIHQKTYGEFLRQKGGLNMTSGEIVDTDGHVIGTHPGLHLFTIGQRRGINCPAPEPYYVVRIDVKYNRLIVGRKADLLSRRCRVKDINWMTCAPSEPIHVETRVRYRHKAAPSKLDPINSTEAEITFDAPQSALTPGQCAVFYRNEEVLGGGWITNE
jgi:tRNA-specific 2-thiouridylase